MSIPTEGYKHPTVAAAIEQASDIVDGWRGHLDGNNSLHAAAWKHAALEAVLGWEGCALVERIAVALLEHQRIYYEGPRCQCSDDEACKFVQERDAARAEVERLRQVGDAMQSALVAMRSNLDICAAWAALEGAAEEGGEDE